MRRAYTVRAAQAWRNANEAPRHSPFHSGARRRRLAGFRTGNLERSDDSAQSAALWLWPDVGLWPSPYVGLGLRACSRDHSGRAVDRLADALVPVRQLARAVALSP